MITMLNSRDSKTSLEGLNRIIRTLSQSIIMYLAAVYPRSTAGSDPGLELLHTIADDHRHLIDELAAFVLQRRGVVNRGAFPIEFTDLHDLSTDFLLKRAQQLYRCEQQQIEKALELIEDQDPGLAVAQRVLGAVRGHLESLNEQASGI